MNDKPKRYIPFGYKLLVSYILICLIPIIVIGLVSYFTYMSNAKEQARDNMNDTLRQIGDNVSMKLEDIRRISDLLYNDYTLASDIQNFNMGWESYESTVKYVIPKFQSTISATGQDIKLTVYINNPLFPELYGKSDSKIDPLVSQKQSFEMFNLNRIENEAWYRNFPKEQYGITMSWQQIEDDRAHGNISFLRRLVDSSDPFAPEQIGFIRIATKISGIFQSLDYRKLGTGTVVYAVDNQDRVMYSSDDGVIQRDWQDEPSPNKIVISQSLPGINMKLVAVIPTHALENKAKSLTNLTIFLSLASIVICIAASLLISRVFSKRVGKVVSLLRLFQEGEYDRRIRYRGEDEFAFIASALNQLGEHMNRMIKETYLTKIEEQELELKLLQAQINPHFLYNTLSSISRLAQFGEVDKLQLMVMALSKFYRNSLNNGETFISVENELEQVKAYIEIQRIKFRDRLSAEFDIDPSVRRFHTVKLILQPFVENVIEHAWSGEGVICVTIQAALEDDRVVFRIIDDGCGMTEETIAQIFTPNDGVYLGYGIRNVAQRIKLYFGPQYGVRITSRIGGGTCVEIRTPTVGGQRLGA
ncbi:HAMP domain-containing protein [Cohnella sp. OV330]|uniref:cache domain-containing sensor histidine kinase n=1 Tax=Cohnella sp. OV330 TaxID=1855288 RepID=UPI0008EBD7BB|nr:sensor histidine kinase [Cohnella sp. OV330]SFB49573.1 HAMP domain-containing protein [Cohnella sp. OV330]